MNNKDFVNIVGFSVMILVIIAMYFFRYAFLSVPENIMNENWYHYNILTGNYEKIVFSNNKVEYYRPSNIKDLNEYDICKKYNYDKKNSIINLDCNKSIKISKFDDNILKLLIDKKEQVFFKNIDETLNYEFNSYFGKSLTEYKNEKEQAKEYISINEKKLFEVLKQDEFSKIIFIGNKCSSIDCVLTLDIMEKLISKTENVYFYNSDLITDDTIKKLLVIDKSLESNISFYNGLYPRVIISKNNKIIDQYEIKCKGFNCSSYFNNEF